MAGNTFRIERIEPGEGELRVWLHNCSQPLDLPWFWVRDHSQDAVSIDTETWQRRVDSFAIDPHIQPVHCEVVGEAVHIDWAGAEPRSELPASLLRRAAAVSGIDLPGIELSGIDLPGIEPGCWPGPSPWHSPDELTVDPVSCRQVMDSDDALADWLGAVNRFGFGLVSGTPGDIPSAEALVNRVGYVRRTIFGDLWTLSSDEVDHADSAYSTTYLEPHTDGTYSHDGPGLQLFACVDRTGTGGDSVLVDGLAAAELLRRDDPEAFDLLTTVSVPAHYIEDGVELRATRPTIRLAADGSVEQVTFNNYDRSAFLLPADRLRAWYRAYGALHDLIIDRDRWWTHRLEPGDTLLFDNWRCLHGRLAYTGTRKFHGCYLNHEDLESRLRVISR
jgi:hypothetical protein